MADRKRVTINKQWIRKYLRGGADLRGKLALLGVSPKAGWKKRVVGLRVDIAVAQRIQAITVAMRQAEIERECGDRRPFHSTDVLDHRLPGSFESGKRR